MRKTLLLICALIGIIALAAPARAATGHITLLTVTDDAHNVGGTADLYLEIKPGTGSIYIDSFPLTKVDTQSSIRYANQIACDMLQKDCSQYDFFYTIRANSAIVGGPSAGGAIAVLTVAQLDGLDLDQHTAMTGTINSGGIIGPVAGVTAKVRGAKAAGITKVLIPALTPSVDLSENASLQGVEGVDNETDNSTAPVPQEPLQQGRVAELSGPGMTVIRVGTVEDALYEFTGKNFTKPLPALAVPQEYAARMDAIAADICSRTEALHAEVAKRNLTYNDSHNYSDALTNISDGRDYSRASLCFSKNIELNTLLLRNESASDRQELYRQLRVQLQDEERKTREQNITTISDLEAYAIVQERALEAQTVLNGDDAQDPHNLAYVQERLMSAQSWSRFFGMPGKHVQLDQAYLQRACLAKLGEAEERVNYVRLYAPKLVDESESMLSQAQTYSGTEPILCIFTASKAKAQANVMADAISIEQQNVDALVQQKLSADEMAMRKQQEKGFFPILGYSYTQYAADLRGRMPYSALIFSEYAIELSNLDMYFPKEQPLHLPPGLSDAAILFGLGAIFGAGIAAFIVGRSLNARAARAAGANGNGKRKAAKRKTYTIAARRNK